MDQTPKITILEDSTNAILAARKSIAEVLPSLWLSLDPVFGLEEESESSAWVTYREDWLYLFSSINLRVKDPDKTRSLTSIKDLLSVTGIEGLLQKTPLNTYALVYASGVSEAHQHAVRLFCHSGVSYLFAQFYINLVNIHLDSFDEQAMGHAYFNFMLNHGLITMTNGIVQVKKEEISPDGTKIPGLYSGLYKEQG
jgi:hypothetical protein